MSEEVVNYYQNYREEDRITTNNARRIEFLTTIHKFDELLNADPDDVEDDSEIKKFDPEADDIKEEVTNENIVEKNSDDKQENLKDETPETDDEEETPVEKESTEKSGE